MATKKIEPTEDQVNEAKEKSSGVDQPLADVILRKAEKPELADLLKFQQRVNQNLLDEKAASESGDFD